MVGSKVRSLSRGLRRACFVLVLGCSLTTSLSPGQSSEEEKRLKELFLKSRQEMEIVPSPTPTSKPTPIPATSPRRPPRHTGEGKPTPNRTEEESIEPRGHPTETPEPTAVETPTPTAAPRVETQTPSPEPPQEEESFATPTPKKKRHGWWFFGFHSSDDEIVVQKSGSENDTIPAGHYNGRWRYLTPAVRRAIDDARVARNRWKYIVVHNSGTRQGNARIFDYYHRHVRRMQNGLAYHFVIGNGTSSGDGQIEIGHRWVQQLAGGHVHSDYLNYISIGICLVGDFNRDLPSRAEYEALDELIRYLRQRVGKIDGKYSIVLGHKEINPRPTDCPGNRFPLNWLHRTFPSD